MSPWSGGGADLFPEVMEASPFFFFARWSDHRGALLWRCMCFFFRCGIARQSGSFFSSCARASLLAGHRFLFFPRGNVRVGGEAFGSEMVPQLHRRPLGAEEGSPFPVAVAEG